MAKKFTTSCTAHGGILDGSMELDTGTGKVTSYKSTKAGKGAVTNSGHSAVQLNFKVKFATGNQRYPVTATPDGNGGWGGYGGIRSSKVEIEPWSATAT